MAYVLQIACIAMLAEALFRVVPVASAGFRYAYWRLVLAAALVMPWVLRAPPSDGPPVVEAAALGPAAVVLTQASGVATALTESAIGWLPLLLAILSAGTVVRFVWVMAGVVRLRALRRSGIPVHDAAYEEIQQRLGTRAELRSTHISQPATFGIWRPVVLLPLMLDECAPGIRRAAVTHELIHVHRRDWLFVMAEEALRAIFWFHPAIWWMTSRIRLTREEFTDHLAVLATGSRRSYMEALLTFADAGRLEPAPAFIRRTDLFHRIVLLSKESAMSSRRIVMSGIVLAALLGAGGWYASEAFPVPARDFSGLAAGAGPSALRGGAPPAARQAEAAAVNPITPENPIPRRVFATRIPYPLELAGTGLESAISVRVVLDAGGSVASAFAGARAVGTPGGRPDARNESAAMETFAAAAVDAIRQWQYEPPARAPLAFYVGVTFKPGADATAVQSEQSRSVVAEPAGARLATPEEEARLARSIAAKLQQAGARSGGAGNPPRINETVTVGANGTPVRVGGNVMAPNQIRKVAPVYPDVARAARVQGVVILEATINEQGRVSGTRILRSIPLLDQAAIDAVQQWEYVPTLLNGVPVPVILTTTVQFLLEQ